jgi:hypothetical protein
MSTKKCQKCQQKLPIESFGLITTRKNKQGECLRKSRCKECLSSDQINYIEDKGEKYKEYRQEYEHNWRYYNEEHLESYERNRNTKRKIEWSNFMKDKKCQNCGFDDTRALQWHHKDPSQKKFIISSAVYSRYKSWLDIMLEISKCECLCANCHFIRHHELRSRTS